MLNLIYTWKLQIYVVMVMYCTTVTAEDCPSNDRPVCFTPDCVTAAAKIIKDIDTSINPCNDLYGFSCNGWIKDQRIGGLDTGDTAFEILNTKRLFIQKNMLSEPSSEDDLAVINKTKDMYKACLNETQVFATTKPRVMAILEEMGKWPLITPNWTHNGFDWVKLEARVNNNPITPRWLSPLIGMSVYYDYTRNASEKRIFLTSVSTGTAILFLLDQDKYRRQIEAYKDLIMGVAIELGNQTQDDLLEQVEAVVAFESQLANIMSNTTFLLGKNTFINMSLGELTERTNHSLPWVRLLQLIFENITEINETERVIIYDESYIFQIGKLIADTDNKTLANYMMWKCLLPILIHLTSKTQALYNDFTGSNLRRWVVCVNDVDFSFEIVLGRQFVESELSNNTKNKVTEIAARIQRAFITMLSKEKWLDDETRQIAIDKANNTRYRVGYPESILDDLNNRYQDVEISATDYFYDLGNVAKSTSREWLQSLRYRPANKDSEGYTPQTANARYSAIPNTIDLPALILKPSIFYPNGIRAVNYGGIGSIAGHEISHAFDSNGIKYTKDGVMSDWLTPQSKKNFAERAECFADQYSKFCPEELNGTVCVDGNFTLPDNIDDNVGVKIAFKAYQEWAKQHGSKEKSLPGLQKFTGEQLFFISFAQLWCEDLNADSERENLFTDSHSPGRYRVNGVAANSQEFQRVFNCTSKPDARICELW